jgi:hypothetical protein
VNKLQPGRPSGGAAQIAPRAKKEPAGGDDQGRGKPTGSAKTVWQVEKWAQRVKGKAETTAFKAEAADANVAVRAEQAQPLVGSGALPAEVAAPAQDPGRVVHGVRTSQPLVLGADDEHGDAAWMA